MTNRRKLTPAQKEKMERFGACTVDGCERPKRSRHSPYCETHYYRVRRTGSVADPEYAHRTKDVHGYVLVRLSEDHPLRGKRIEGWCFEHRKVFFDEHGAGPHPCFWCGQELEWDKVEIDHVNGTRDDNSLGNLVASCKRCNLDRALHNMVDTARSNAKQYTHEGKTMSLPEWAERLGMSEFALRWRLNNGWSLEKALSQGRGKNGPERTKTRRKYLTQNAKQELWEQQGCQCANPECCAPMTLEEVQWDHVRPLWAGGTNEENWQGLCVDCHREKTRREATERAKADRQGKKHRGEHTRKSRPLQSRGFDRRWRKKLNGEVEYVGDGNDT